MRRFALLVVLALVVSCGREQPAVRQQTTTIDDLTPRDGGTLYRRLEIDIAGLNPIIAANKYDRYVGTYLFTPLLRVDKNLEPMPGIAKKWTVSKDGRLYTFELNEKATFSDGKPVRASDVIFTLRKIVDPASEAIQIAGAFEHLDLSRTRAIDDHTLEIGFKQPLASQLSRFNDVMILPEHVYSKGNFLNDFNSANVIGSGAYKLVRRLPGTEVVLERRDDHWEARPRIKTVVFKVVGEHKTAWNAVKIGDIDETLITSDTWAREQNNPSLKKILNFERYYSRNYNYIAWNNRSALFSDKRVRKAMAMCMPIEAIVRDLYHGTARAMTGHFIPDQWAYNPQVPVIRYDPEGAKKLLAEAEWRDRNGDGILDRNGKPFKFDLIIMTGNVVTKQLGQMVQAELKNIGVDMQLMLLEGGSAIHRMMEGNYEAVYSGWDLDPDPDPHALFHSQSTPPRGQNFVFYSNPEADRLIDAARRELDQGKRKELYHRLHAVLAEDQPYCWMIQASAKYAMTKRLRNVQNSRGFGFFGWYPGELDWWLASDRAPR